MRPQGQVQGRQRASLRTDCPPATGVRGGKCRPPEWAAAAYMAPECGANVIQHNAGDYAHSRRAAQEANSIRREQLVFA
ncbi:Uncharacterised protein [Salmonella enterica subsp. arizonae]|uniref:Uncharacterized protein n=1 Tax=Salmonella enterica subsp. arizonae TaxID=59203 RepID=A0A379SF59_SALER|nr:Uncharacterised protein [Salmonella enterica subsp. arizonae]